MLDEVWVKKFVSRTPLVTQCSVCPRRRRGMFICECVLCDRGGVRWRLE